MKKLLTTILTLFVAYHAKSQNEQFRVSKITETKYNAYSDQPDYIQSQSYQYSSDGNLEQIVITENGSPSDVLSVTYKANEASFFSKDWDLVMNACRSNAVGPESYQASKSSFINIITAMLF